MSVNCTYLAPNGEKSLLAQQLDQRFGPTEVLRLWTYARTHLNEFSVFDVNGEPLIDDVVAFEKFQTSANYSLQQKFTDVGNFVIYNNEEYLVVRNEPGKDEALLYSEKLAADPATKSKSKVKVAFKNLTPGGPSDNLVVQLNDTLYIVTPQNEIYSTVSGNAMKWDKNNSNRKSIIALAEKTRPVSPEPAKLQEVTSKLPSPTVLKALRETKQPLKLSVDKKGKDQGKANLATAVIAYALPNTSSAAYYNDAVSQGYPVNEAIQPTENTVAFVSVNGNGKLTEENFTKTVEQAKRVLAAGGAIVMDSTDDAKRAWNVTGEKRVQDALGTPAGQTSKGYNYWGFNPETKERQVPSQPKPASSETTTEEEVTIGSHDYKTRNTPEEIQQLLADFVETAKANPEKVYRLPYVAATMSTFLDNNVSALTFVKFLDKVGLPDNVRIDPSLRVIYDNLPSRYLPEFFDGVATERKIVNRSGTRMDQQRNMTFIPMYAESTVDGKTTLVQIGNMTPEQQVQAVQATVQLFQQYQSKDPDAGPVKLFSNIVEAFYKGYKKSLDNEAVSEESKKLAYHLVKSFSAPLYLGRTSVLAETIKTLEEYGVIIKKPELVLEQVYKMVKDLVENRTESVLKEVKDPNETEESTIENVEATVEESIYDDTDDFSYQDGEALADFFDSAINKDPKDTASWQIKLLLGTLKEVTIVPNTAVFTVKPLRNMYGAYYLVDFHQAFQRLQALLADQPIKGWVAYRGVLEKHLQKYPYFKQLIDKLDTPGNEHLRNEFVKVMNMNYTQFITVTHDIRTSDSGNTRTKFKVFNANRGAQKTTMLEEWREAQKLAPGMTAENGVYQIDKSKFVKYTNWFRIMDLLSIQEDITAKARRKEEWNERFAEEVNRRKRYAYELLEAVNSEKEVTVNGVNLFVENDIEVTWNNLLLHRTTYEPILVDQYLKLHGIQFTDRMLTELLTNSRKWAVGTNAGGTLYAYDQNKNQPLGILARHADRAAGLFVKSYLDQAGYIADSEVTTTQGNNPLYAEKPSNDVLLNIAMAYTDFRTNNSHLGGDGKSRYDFSLITLMRDRFNDILRGGNYLNTKNKDFPMYAHTRMLQRGVQFGRIDYADVIKSSWAEAGKTREGMSLRENIAQAVAMFQSNRSGYTTYMGMTHSDKTMTPLYVGFPKVGQIGIAAKPHPYILGDVFNVALNEYERIRHGQTIQFNHDVYNAGKFIFFKIPELNKEYMLDSIKKGKQYNIGRENPRVLTEKDIKLVWNEDGTIVEDLTAQGKAVMRAITDDFAARLEESTIKRFKRDGLVDEKAMTFLFDRDYVSHLVGKIEGLTFNKQTKSYQRQIAQNGFVEVTKAELFDIIVRLAARDFGLNNWIHNAEISDLLFGDIAQFLKVKSSDLDSKSGRVKPERLRAAIFATYAEYSKRLAKDIAPGQQLEFYDDTYKSVTLTDPVIMRNYLTNEKVRGAYGAIKTATDAQELTTVEEHLTVMYSAGKITKKVFDEMIKIVKDANGGYYAFKDPEHLKVIMQPMKPVYVNFRTENKVEFVDYIKTSSYPLYPPFLQNKELDDLRVAMESRGIARAAFASGKKAGRPSKTLTVLDKDGRYVVPTETDWTTATQTLQRAGLRIQQEVPLDETKEEIKVVTQMHKLVTEGLANMQTSTFKLRDGREMDGAALRTLKERNKARRVERSLEKFRKEFGFTASTSKEARQKVLTRLLAEAEARGYTENELSALRYITEDGELEIPLFYSPVSGKYESLLLSLVKDIVKLKMAGKSYVQATGTGHRWKKGQIQNLSDTDTSGIVWIDGYTPTEELRTLRQENGVVLEAEVVLPFDFLMTDQNGQKVPADITNFLKPGTNILDPEKVPEALLRRIGARIPNQSHSSQLALKVVGFAPAAMGDLILVPPEITIQMGADFDVDKLYTYRLNYVYKDGKFVVDEFTTKRSQLGADPDEYALLEKETLSRLGVTPGKKVDQRVFRKMLGTVVNERYPDGNVPKHEVEDINAKPTDKHDQNEYFDIHWAILTHPDMYEKILSPLDMDDLANENALLKPEDPEFFSYFDELAQIDDFQSGKYAKALVGMTSLSVTFNALIQNLDLHLSFPTLTPAGIVRIPYDVELNGLKLNRISGYGTSQYYNEKIGKWETRTKSQNLVMLQNAAVDNAKNRTLDNLNLTPVTYPAAAALLMLEDADGHAVNITLATRMMASAILKEFTKRVELLGDSFGDGKGGDDKAQRVIDALLTEYKPEEGTPVPELTAEFLLAEFKNPTKAGQYAILQTFSQLLEIGNRLTSLQGLFNQDTKGAGKNILQALHKETQLQTLMNDNAPGSLGGEPSLLSNVELRTNFQAAIGTTLALSDLLFPYRALTYKTGPDEWTPLQIIQNQLGKKFISGEFQKKLFDAGRGMTIAAQTSMWHDADAERVRLLYNRPGSDSLATRIQNSLQSWGQTNVLIKSLTTTLGDGPNSPQYVEFNGFNGALMAPDLAVRVLMDMLQGVEVEAQPKETEEQKQKRETENAVIKEKREIAEDIVKYAFLTASRADKKSLIPKVPTSYLTDTEFARELRGRTTKESFYRMLSSTAFLKQFVQHNPTQAIQFPLELLAHPKSNVLYLEPIESENSPTAFLQITNREGQREYPRFVATRDGANRSLLFERVSENQFIRIPVLGNSHIDEFRSSQRIRNNSILQENRVPVKLAPMAVNDTNYSLISDAKSQNKPDGLSYLGLSKKNGTNEDMMSALRTVASDTAMPPHLRLSATFLSTLNELGTESLVIGDDFKAGTVFQRLDRSGIGGSYNSSTNTLTVSPGTRVEVASVLAHELFHRETAHIIASMGWKAQLLRDQAGNPKLQPQIDKFRERHAAVEPIIKAIDELRYGLLQRFLNKIKQEQGEAELERYLNVLAKNGWRSEDDDTMRIVYALSNVDEFIAHAMTNEKFMRFLSSQETTLVSEEGRAQVDQNVFEALMELVAKMLAEFASYYGIEVSDTSALRDALILTSKISSYQNEYKKAERLNRTKTEDALTNPETPVDIPATSEAHATETRQLLARAGIASKMKSDANFNFTVITNPDGSTELIQVAPSVEKLIKKLVEQVQHLQDKANAIKVDTIEEKRAVRDLWLQRSQVQKDIITLGEDQQMTTIAAIGNKQLEWVRKIMNKPKPTAQEVMAVLEILSTWSEAVTLVYADTSEPVAPETAFSEMTALAQQLRKSGWMQLAQRVITEEAEKIGYKLAPTAFHSDLTDTDWATLQTRAATMIRSPLPSTLITIGRNALELRSAHILKIRERLDAWETKAKKVSGGNLQNLYDEFTSVSEDNTVWSLITRYSPLWLKFVNNTDQELSRKLELASLLASPDARKMAVKDAYRVYWKAVKQNTDFVDIRKFVDLETGEKLDDATYKTNLQALIARTGTTEHAEELLEEAISEYHAFLDRKSLIFEDIDNTTSLSEQDRLDITQQIANELDTFAGMSPTQVLDYVQKRTIELEATKLTEKIQEKKEQWEKYESPVRFLEYQETLNPVNGHGNMKYVVKFPKKEKSEFYDANFVRLQTNPAKLELFKEYDELYEELHALLPNHVQDKMQRKALPQVATQTTMSLSSVLNSMKPGNIANAIYEGYTISQYEKDAQQKGTLALPIFKKYVPKGEEAPAPNWNRNLAQVMESFSRSALHYHYLSEVADVINMGESFIAEENIARLNGTSTGVPLTNTLKAFAYWKQAALFQNPKTYEKELTGKDAHYSPNPKENKRIIKRIDELNKRRDELQEKIDNEETLTPNEKTELDSITKELTNYAEQARYVSGTKIGDKLITYNQLRALAYNPFAALTNFTFGFMAVFMHGNGRADYNGKETIQAMKILRHSWYKWTTFGMISDKESQKILHIMQHFGIMSTGSSKSYEGSDLQSTKTSSGLSQLSPLGLQHNGDYFTKGMLAISMLLHKKVTVTEDGVTREIPVYEALNERGEWDTQRFGPMPGWSDVDSRKQTDFNKLRLKIKTTSTRIFGNQDDNSPLYARSKLIGRLVGQFRLSWFPEGVAARLEKERWDPALERYVKGRYRTIPDLGWAVTGKVLLRQLWSALPGVSSNAFEGIMDKNHEKISEVDIENMRRNFAELSLVVSFAIAILVAKGFMPDDEEKKRRRRQGLPTNPRATMMLINMLTRNYQDLRLYSSPGVVETVTGNIIPVFSLIKDTNKLLNRTTALLGDDPKAVDRWVNAFLRLIPGGSQLSKYDYLTTRDLEDISK